MKLEGRTYILTHVHTYRRADFGTKLILLFFSKEKSRYKNIAYSNVQCCKSVITTQLGSWKETAITKSQPDYLSIISGGI